jgi:hypothetical protein
MVNLVAADDGEATLLMATFCALHDVELEAGELAARTEEAPGRGSSLMSHAHRCTSEQRGAQRSRGGV